MAEQKKSHKWVRVLLITLVALFIVGGGLMLNLSMKRKSVLDKLDELAKLSPTTKDKVKVGLKKLYWKDLNTFDTYIDDVKEKNYAALALEGADMTKVLERAGLSTDIFS